jgi:glycosyltransferase involved in cell wall biosynthesis
MRCGDGVVFVSWAPFCSRSDGIAARLGGRSFMVYSPAFGSNYLTVFFKYLSQTLKTLRLLWRERPDVVYVMTPPVTACVPVWIYSRLAGARFVIDAHTGAFIGPWLSLLFLHRWFSRAACATIVTNEHYRDLVRGWGADVMIVRDVPVRFAEPVRPDLGGPCNMTLVATFTPDEPIELFFAAAARLPDIQFHVTGKYQRGGPQLLAAKPDNVRLTGFLPDADYVGLLLASDAVMSLTTLDNTMQRGAYEGVYLGKPVITSNFDLLRRHFYKGAVHVDNTIEDIVAGVRRMRDNLPQFRSQVLELRSERLRDWSRVETELRGLAAAGSGVSDS